MFRCLYCLVMCELYIYTDNKYADKILRHKNPGTLGGIFC